MVLQTLCLLVEGNEGWILWKAGNLLIHMKNTEHLTVWKSNFDHNYLNNVVSKLCFYFILSLFAQHSHKYFLLTENFYLLLLKTIENKSLIIKECCKFALIRNLCKNQCNKRKDLNKYKQTKLQIQQCIVFSSNMQKHRDHINACNNFILYKVKIR